MKKFLLITAIFVFIFLLQTKETKALSCVEDERSLTQRYKEDDVVFVGEALKVSSDSATFKVKRAWKGMKENEEVKASLFWYHFDEYLRPVEGELYLITYKYRNGNKDINLSPCHPAMYIKKHTMEDFEILFNSAQKRDNSFKVIALASTVITVTIGGLTYIFMKKNKK